MNVIIVHGCPSKDPTAEGKPTTYNQHWMPWVKRELVAEGIPTEVPLMPNPWAPDYQSYKKEFEKYHVSEETVLVGHSCGCAFLVRWLGETKQKIKKLILVAPWKIADKQDNFRTDFYNYPIDRNIKSRVGEIVMFTADDEEDDGKKSLKMYHEALGGKVIELKGRGHYTFDDMKTEIFSELRDEILEKEEDEEEEGEEESEEKSKKTGRSSSAMKNLVMLAATAVASAAVGAGAGFYICQSTERPTTNNAQPTPVVTKDVTKPAPAPAPAAVTPPRSISTPSPTGTSAGSISPSPATEPAPSPEPSADGTTP